MDKTDVALRQREIYKVTLAGSVVNIVLTLCKFAAGILGRSAAMVADAVHSLSDLATDVIVLVFVRISGKPEDKGHDYGHGKYETFATLLIGVALLVVGIGILWSGGERIYAFFRGETLDQPGWIALAAALVSIVSKEVLFQYTRRIGRKYDSPSVIANAWHHRSDAFSSIGTAAGIGGAILLGEDWRVLVSFFIIHVAVKQLGPCLDELLERSLPDDVEQRITDLVLSVDGVSQPHHLRTRRVGNRYAIDLHIRMDGDMPLREAHERATRIEQKLRDEYGSGTYINVHVEPVK
jgi:cation diffusion facilitator family transporter